MLLTGGGQQDAMSVDQFVASLRNASATSHGTRRCYAHAFLPAVRTSVLPAVAKLLHPQHDGSGISRRIRH